MNVEVHGRFECYEHAAGKGVAQIDGMVLEIGHPGEDIRISPVVGLDVETVEPGFERTGDAAFFVGCGGQVVVDFLVFALFADDSHVDVSVVKLTS